MVKACVEAILLEPTQDGRVISVSPVVQLVSVQHLHNSLCEAILRLCVQA